MVVQGLRPAWLLSYQPSSLTQRRTTRKVGVHVHHSPLAVDHRRRTDRPHRASYEADQACIAALAAKPGASPTAAEALDRIAEGACAERDHVDLMTTQIVAVAVGLGVIVLGGLVGGGDDRETRRDQEVVGYP